MPDVPTYEGLAETRDSDVTSLAMEVAELRQMIVMLQGELGEQGERIERDDAGYEGIRDAEMTDNTATAWQLVLDGTTATILNGVIQRGPKAWTTASFAVADFDAVGNEVWIYARINTQTHAIECLTADSFANATDATLPASDTYLKKPLYRLERATSGDPFFMTLDCRTMLEMVVRV